MGLRRDLLISLASQQHVAGLPDAEKRGPHGSARQWLAFIDLHGLDQRHAMQALRARLSLLESGCARPGTPLPPSNTPLPNSWLPKHLTIVTGWGANAQPQGYSVLRNNVNNFLRSNAYDYMEVPRLGCGRFEVKLGRRRGQ